MRWRSPLLTSVIVIFFALGAAAPGVGGGENTEGTGAVEGLVVSDSFEAIEGAELTLMHPEKDNRTTTTDEEGRYSFADVEPDTYRLVASKDGYRTGVSKAEVTAGEVTEISFMLEEGPQPWVDGPHEWTGFISCAIMTVADCGALDPNHSLRGEHSLVDGLRTATFALEWNPAPVTGIEEMRLVVEDDQGHTLAEITGSSPLELRIDDDFEDAAGLTFRVEPQSLVTYQQQFTLYYALHYLEPAPEGYSVLPEK